MSDHFDAAVAALHTGNCEARDQEIVRLIGFIRDGLPEEASAFEVLCFLGELMQKCGLDRTSAEIMASYKLVFVPRNAKEAEKSGATIDLTAHPLGAALGGGKIEIGEAALKALGMGPYSLFRMQNSDVLANAVHGAIMAHALHFNRPNWQSLQRELAEMGMGYLTEVQLEVKVETSWRVLGHPDTVGEVGFPSRVDRLLMCIREKLKQP